MVLKKENRHIKFKAKILNNFLLKGKKNKIENLIKKSIKSLQKKTYKDHKAMLIYLFVLPAPFIKMFERKKKKKIIKFPYVIDKKVRLFYGLKVIKQTLKKKNQSFLIKFVDEIKHNDINSSKFLQAKKTLYEDSFINKKFSNYRWK